MAENKGNEETKRKKGQESISNKSGKKKVFNIVILGIIIAIAVILRVAIFSNHPPKVPHSPTPAPGSVLKAGKVVFSWKCEDPDGDPVRFDLLVSRDGVNFSTVAKDLENASYTLFLEPGVKVYWKVNAKDDKGAVSKSPLWSFSISRNRPPEVPISVFPEPDTTIKTNTVKFIWSGKDPDGDPVGYTLYVDGKEIVETEKTSHIIDLDYGRHSWQVVAKDKWGALSEGGPWVFFIEKANSTPTVMLTTPLSDLKEGRLKISWEGYDEDGDNLTYSVYLDGKFLGETTKNSTLLNLSAGSHSLKIVVSDGKSFSEKVYKFDVKKHEKKRGKAGIKSAPPLVPFGPYPPVGAELSQGMVRLSWGCTDYDSDVLKYDLYVDGLLIAKDITVPHYEYEFKPGLHKWKVVAKDPEGNVTEGPVWTFRVVSSVTTKETKEEKVTVIVAAGTTGVALIDIFSGKILDRYSAYPVDVVDRDGNVVLAAYKDDLLIFTIKDGVLSLNKILNVPFSVQDTAIKAGKIYAVGSGKVYFNGTLREVKGARAIATDGVKVYVGAGNKVLIFTMDGKPINEMEFENEVIKVYYEGELFVKTTSKIYLVKNGKRISLELPSPEDVTKTNTGFAIADFYTGVVLTDENLKVKDVISLKGIKSVVFKDGYVVAGGKGLYVIEDGVIVNKIGSGKAVYEVCGEFYISDDGIYKGEKKIFSGRVNALDCDEKNWAAVVNGEVVINGKETGDKALDVSIYENRVFASCGDFVRVYDTNGYYTTSIGEKAEKVDKIFAAYDDVLYKIGEASVKVGSKILGISADVIVSLLERERVDIYSWNLKKIGTIPVKATFVFTKGNYIFVGVENGVKIYDIKGNLLSTIDLLVEPLDVELEGNVINVAVGSLGMVKYYLRVGGIPELQSFYTVLSVKDLE